MGESNYWIKQHLQRIAVALEKIVARWEPQPAPTVKRTEADKARLHGLVGCIGTHDPGNHGPTQPMGKVRGHKFMAHTTWEDYCVHVLKQASAFVLRCGQPRSTHEEV